MADASSEHGAKEARKRDLDAETDEVLRHIESQTGSLYAVHAGDAEDLDPAALHADEVGGENGIAQNMAHGIPLDEPAEGLDAAGLDASGRPDAAPREGRAGGEETAAHPHRGLKRALVAVIAVLVVAVVAIGVLVWRGGDPVGTADVGQSDTRAMQSAPDTAGTVEFQRIDVDKVPGLASVFGKKLASAKERLGDRLSLGEPEAAKDKRVKAQRELAEGEYRGENGVKVADVGLGTDAKGRVVYAYALYNLDEIGVEDATFSELVTNNVVGTSVLENLGVEKARLGSPKLDLGDEREQARYQGSTGNGKAPKTWRLVETYTYSSGSTTARTLLAELW